MYFIGIIKFHVWRCEKRSLGNCRLFLKLENKFDHKLSQTLGYYIQDVEQITKADLMRVTPFAKIAKSAPCYGGLVPPLSQKK